jgi:diaminopimelate decarboxylase
MEFKIGAFTAKDLVEMFGSPLYVYDENIIRQKYRELNEAFSLIKNKKILYACKANSNIEIIKILREEGAGIDVVSCGEIYCTLKAGCKKEDILFTGNSLTNDEIKYSIENNILLNVGDISTLERLGKMFPNSNVCIRINPDIGGGHHEHVITGGPESKFGIYYSDINKAISVAKKYNLRIKGIHQHIGSNILDEETFLLAVDVLLKVAINIPNLDFVDFGGGLGIPYKPEDKNLDLNKLKDLVTKRFNDFLKEYKKDVSFWIEPGRYLVAESGYLLTTVNTLNENPNYKYVCTDSGFNHLIRPTMYGSYHHIINTSSKNQEMEVVTIVGNICESGDIFARNRKINKVEEGDILAITNAGAYGYSMASNYNSRPLPAEVLVKEDSVKLIRRRELFEELLRNQIFYENGTGLE